MLDSALEMQGLVLVERPLVGPPEAQAAPNVPVGGWR